MRVQQLLAELRAASPDAAEQFCGAEIAVVAELARQVSVVSERGPLPAQPQVTLKQCVELHYPS
jgi:hypothetical protein